MVNARSSAVAVADPAPIADRRATMPPAPSAPPVVGERPCSVGTDSAAAHAATAAPSLALGLEGANDALLAQPGKATKP